MGDYIENYKNKILHYINIPLIQYSFNTGDSHMFYLTIGLLLAKNKQKTRKVIEIFLDKYWVLCT